MKCPNKKAGLPDMPPFPGEYHGKAEYLLKQVEYNMRVRFWDFIRAAKKVDPEGKISPAVVLAMALQAQAKKMQLDADAFVEQVSAGEATDRLLKSLGLSTEPDTTP